MQVIRSTNVNDALPEILRILKPQGITAQTRNGPVLQFSTPLAVTYTRPEQRVLFWPLRDANPYFHLMEAIWMLGGREDVAFPARFVKRMREYSDDGKTLSGAYGYRWRNHFGVDQLNTTIRTLRHDKGARRAVIGMWDPGSDPARVLIGGKDVPCNLCITFHRNPVMEKALDMVVFNRSNDIIWGMCGANAVHMSILHEYIALACGMEMGAYTQISSNAHMYLNDQGSKLMAAAGEYTPHPYQNVGLVHLPLFTEGPARFMRDVENFLNNPTGDQLFTTKFMGEVVAPMMDSWVAHEKKDYKGSVHAAEKIIAEDWRNACLFWLERRL